MPPLISILAILVLISPLYIVFKNNNIFIVAPPKEDTLIVVITATWKTVTRIPDLFMLANTLAHEKDLYWLVVDNSTNHTEDIAEIIERSELPSVFLNIKTTNNSNFTTFELYNAGLSYLRKIGDGLKKGYKKSIIYFASADFSYDSRLWNKYVRKVEQLGVWHVGRAYYRRENSIYGLTYFDLANLAINYDIIKKSYIRFDKNCDLSSIELCFVRDLHINKKEIQFLDGPNTEEYLVYHAPKGFERFLYEINLFDFLVEV